MKIILSDNDKYTLKYIMCAVLSGINLVFGIYGIQYIMNILNSKSVCLCIIMLFVYITQFYITSYFLFREFTKKR